MPAPAKTKPAPAPAPVAPEEAPPKPADILPQAIPSRFRRRHALALFSFVLMVIVPAIVSAWYLWTRAADQYASTVGFSVRSEEAGSALTTFLGTYGLGSSNTPDAEILYEFIQSQDLVERIDGQLGLRAIWSKPGYGSDPVFAYDASGSIEDLRDYFRRMVKITHDGGTGLLELRVHAFTAADAQRIAQSIADESTKLINALSDQAREDAIRYAANELQDTVARLKNARRSLTEFRNRTQIVDPTIDVQGQAGLLNQLNTQLAEALIDLDMLRETTRPGDPRISQAERRIRVIETRIDDEKRKLGIGNDTSRSDVFANLVGEYESLVVDREFAERSYTAALSAYDMAQAEAQRQTRYLAIHLRPTLAEAAEYPQRLIIFGMITLFAFLVWSVLLLVAYSLKDRR